MAETNAQTSEFEIGSLTLVAVSRGSAGPGGTTHFVNGWEPVCGSDRVRFRFPGKGSELGANCPDCVQALAVPKQRPAPKPRARRAS